MPKSSTPKNPKLKKPTGATGIPHQKLPVGRLVSSPIKGTFLTLPIFGWVAKRQKTGTPLVMLTLILIRTATDAQPRGTLQVELPIFDDTEQATVATLERYGWDGRVWPLEEGWPTETEDEDAIRAMLAQAALQATFIFPPNAKGASAQEIKVERAVGPFLMPPLPEPEEPCDPEKLEKLRELCKTPEIFFQAPTPEPS